MAITTVFLSYKNEKPSKCQMTESCVSKLWVCINNKNVQILINKIFGHFSHSISNQIHRDHISHNPI